MIISFLKFFIDPFNIFWILLTISIIAWFLKKKRLCKGLVISASIWLLIISTPLVPNLALNSLEEQYTPVYPRALADSLAPFNIVVVGGGHGFDDRLPPNSLLSLNALGRLSEGIRLHRQLPNSRLVLSGSTSIPGRTTQAEMLKKAALLLGVNEEVISLQKEPLNTFQEAKVYAEHHRGGVPVILVTSAAHMPRAMMVFKRFGVQAIASPTNYRLKGSWRWKWFGLPDLDNINNLRAAIYEYVGIVWYSLKS